MKTVRLPAVAILVLISVSALSINAQSPQIKTTFKNEVTTVRMEPLKISGERNEYYSLHVAVSFRYPGTEPKAPEFIDFEIQSVVKGRRLNPDLYIVFLIDEERIFLSSNRWAVKNPVPGRRMIGERIAMRMPLGAYVKLAKANQSTIKMGATNFVIGEGQKKAMLELTKMFGG